MLALIAGRVLRLHMLFGVRSLTILFALASLLIASGASAATFAHKSVAEKTVSIPASDPRFIYEGRFDAAVSPAVGVVWQGSRIFLDFEGDAISLRFKDVKGQCFFDAEVDGRISLVDLREGLNPMGTALKHLGPGRHHLVLFKRSEAAVGSVHFEGVEIADGADAFRPAPRSYKTAFQFFGDSITAGACNEDAAEDQWSDYSTHNNARSYGAFTAQACNADYRNVAVSGMGVVIGYVPMKASEIWDRVYPTVASPRADLGAWTPQVVFVNLGENDDSFSKSKELPFPPSFADDYVALIRSFRKAYPAAQIVVLRGGMYGGAKSDRLRGPWETAVQTVESSDAHVSHFVFQHWSSTHPRVTDHRAMADELIAWLKQQPFMTAQAAAQ